MTEEAAQVFELFYLYAHEDERLLKDLNNHLYNLKRQGLIVDWYDRDISAGTDWEQEIDSHLNTAQIILLLISPDFMASDYCFSIEMTRALERHEAGEARVIPIILKPVEWSGTPFSKLQVLPRNRKAVTSWRDRNAAFVEIANNIRETIKDLRKFSAINRVPSPESAFSPLPSLPDSSLQSSKELKSQEKVQLHLDFSLQALERLDRLKDRINADTRAETIRQALRLLEWFTLETNFDDTVTITDRQSNITTRIKAALLYADIYRSLDR